MFFNRHLRRSQNDAGATVHCVFRNDTDISVAIRWVDEDGTLDDPRHVEPNQSHVEQTYVGHAFAFYDDGKNLLFSYEAEKTETISIGEMRSFPPPVLTQHVYKSRKLLSGRATCAYDETLHGREIDEFVGDCNAALSRIPFFLLKRLECRIVVDKDARGSDLRGCCYHPRDGGGWLELNGFPAKDLAGAIHIYRLSDYMKDRHLWGKGGVLVHELSHAVHDQFVVDGHGNRLVQKRYEEAALPLYSSVRVKRLNGGFDTETKHYACTDAAEFFAELSTAYLEPESTELYNKWEPFNRPQLKALDPITHALLERVWLRGDSLDSYNVRRRRRKWRCWKN